MNNNHPFGFLVASLLIALSIGCGSSSTPVAETNGNATGTTSTAGDTAVDTTPAMDVVSQFLDALRRGGSDTESLSLVTTKAREEFRRTGLVMQPIGSPDANFEVTRSEPIPGQDDAALVHSKWTEPSDSGEPQTSEVVWAVQNEAGSWKISGMVIGTGAGASPIVVDFENGTDLAAKFQPPAGSQPVANQAAVPTDASSVPLDTPSPVIR